MWWPIRNQILVPFAAILVIAVALTSVSAAVTAARRSERTIVAQLNRVIGTLGTASFPYAQNVLEMMRGLSGAEFVAFDGEQRVIASTLETARALPGLPDLVEQPELSSLSRHPMLTVGDERYFAAAVSRPPTAGNVTTLLVLYPETVWRQARWEAALPPLLVGGATLAVLVMVAAWLADRLSRRIQNVRQHVALIAGGRFEAMPLGSRRDEIQELIRSINCMAVQLREMQQAIAQTERTRLLGQLAGGLAHQLRNAVTGARMAVQIHRRRCERETDESLDVALRQLTLMEEQVKGLLSVGKSEERQPVPCAVGELLDEVAALVAPACRHADLQFTHHVDGDAARMLPDSGSLRTALLNLTLNAIDAAGPGGSVELNAETGPGDVTFDVIDTGPGPPAELADHLFELFVTGKPEGVGFGLPIAKQIAEKLGGTLNWSRVRQRTHFQLKLPVDNESANESQPAREEGDVPIAAQQGQ